MSHLAHVAVCPHCVEDDEAPIHCDRCGWRWYANPRPAAAVVLERELSGGELAVLLLKRAVEPGLGDWDLPAGYLDPGESFEEAAVREAREESGLEVELLGLIGVYHSPTANAVAAAFRGRAVEPTRAVAIDAESSDHAWVPRSEVAAWVPRMAFTSMASALGDWASRRPSTDDAKARAG